MRPASSTAAFDGSHEAVTRRLHPDDVPGLTVQLARTLAGAAQPYAMQLAGNGAYVHCAHGDVVVADTAAFIIEPATEVEVVIVEVPMTRGVRT